MYQSTECLTYSLFQKCHLCRRNMDMLLQSSCTDSLQDMYQYNLGGLSGSCKRKHLAVVGLALLHLCKSTQHQNSSFRNQRRIAAEMQLIRTWKRALWQIMARILNLSFQQVPADVLLDEPRETFLPQFEQCSWSFKFSDHREKFSKSLGFALHKT